MSDSLSERFFAGAIQGLIGCVILYFWLRKSKKKEKKQYEKELKEEIYHDSSHQTTISNNAIELDCYDTIYDELKEKCNPANYMNPYNAEKVEISNLIYSQLDANKKNLSVLIEYRNKAIKHLGLSFSAKELYDKLCEIYNPSNYIGEKYDADKLHIANQIYAKIQNISDDIIGLEKIAKENGITIKGKASEYQHNYNFKLNENTNNNESSNFSFVLAFVIVFLLALVLFFVISKDILIIDNTSDPIYAVDSVADY